MTVKELAQRLDGREYGRVVLVMELPEIVESGLVVVYGVSDDLLEFNGAIDDEVGAYGGAMVRIKNGKILTEPCDCDNATECPAWVEYIAGAKTVAAVWHTKGNPCWTIETEIPHETFRILEDGELFGVGAVFRLEDTRDKPACHQETN